MPIVGSQFPISLGLPLSYGTVPFNHQSASRHGICEMCSIDSMNTRQRGHGEAVLTGSSSKVMYHLHINCSDHHFTCFHQDNCQRVIACHRRHTLSDTRLHDVHADTLSISLCEFFYFGDESRETLVYYHPVIFRISNSCTFCSASSTLMTMPNTTHLTSHRPSGPSWHHLSQVAHLPIWP